MDSSLRESAPVVVALADRTSRGMAVKSQDTAALSSPSGPFPPCRPLTIAEVSGWMNESAKDSLASALSVVVPRFLAAFTSRTRQRTRRIIDTDFDPFGWSVAAGGYDRRVGCVVYDCTGRRPYDRTGHRECSRRPAASRATCMWRRPR